MARLSKPLWSSSDSQPKPFFTHVRNFIYVEEAAEVHIIERHHSFSPETVLTNSVTEVFVEKNALLDYYKLQNDRENALLIDNTYVSQAEESHAAVHTFSFGGKTTRNNLNFFHRGEHIESTLKGLTILKGNQHVDHYTFVEHALPNCESHQDYKSIVDEEAINVFNGKILVEKIAQKTNAYQQNDNIILPHTNYNWINFVRCNLFISHGFLHSRIIQFINFPV